MSTTRGFTLLELMIVVAIAAILLTLAGPGLRDFLLAGARSDAATSLYSAMVLARTEAVTRNAPVTICQRNYTGNSGYAICDSASSGSWANGWVIYRDSKPNKTSTKPFAAADIIATGEPIDAAFSYRTVPTPTLSLQFDPSGRLSASSPVTFRLCKQSNGAYEGRRVQIDLNGRVRLSADTGCST